MAENFKSRVTAPRAAPSKRQTLGPSPDGGGKGSSEAVEWVRYSAIPSL